MFKGSFILGLLGVIVFCFSAFGTGASQPLALQLQLVSGIYGIGIAFDLSLPPESLPRWVHIRFRVDDFAFWRSAQIPGTKLPRAYKASWEEENIGYLRYHSWYRVQLSRKGIWREQIILQRPVTPGFHQLTAEVYLGGKLPADNRSEGSVPQGWSPLLIKSTSLVVPKITLPLSPGEVLLSSIPLGARVYIANAEDIPPEHPDELYEERYSRGVTPLNIELHPGKYLVGYELLGTNKDVAFENDNCSTSTTAYLPDNSVWYRRTYRLKVSGASSSALIGLFQLLDGSLCDPLYLLPQTTNFPIGSEETVSHALCQYGIEKEDRDTLLTIVERGGKAVWKEEYGPLPWLFKDQYIKLILQWSPDKKVKITSTICSNPNPLPAISLTSSEENLALLRKVLLDPETWQPIRTLGIGSFRPIYTVFQQWPIVTLRRHDGSPMSAEEVKNFYASILAKIWAAYSAKDDWRAVAESYKRYLTADFLRYVLMAAEAMSDGNSNFSNLGALPLNSITIELGKEVFPNKDFLGLAYVQRGLIYSNTSQPNRDAALESLKTALSYFDKSPVNWAGVGLAATELGNLLFAWYNRYGDATSYYSRALEAIKKANLGRVSLLTALDNMARVCLVTGQYERALEVSTEYRTLELAGKEGETNWSPFISHIVTEVMIPAALALGRYHLAVEFAERDLVPPHNLPSWEVLAYREAMESAAALYAHLSLEEQAIIRFRALARYDPAPGLLGLGRIFLKKGALPEALLSFQEALHYQEGADRLETLIYLAHVYALAGFSSEFVQTRKEINGLLAEFANVHAYRWLFARVYRNLGYAEYVLKMYDDAGRSFEKAIALDTDMGAADDLWRDLFLQGLVFEKIGHFNQALTSYKESIHSIENIRITLREDVSKTFFLYLRRLPYEHLIKLLIDHDHGADAFPYAERCRARTFLDLLAKGPVGTIENTAEEGIKSGAVNPTAITTDVQDVIKNLPEDTAVLEYFVTDTTTYVWVIRNGKINGPITIPHSRKEVMDKVIDAREQLGSSPEHPFNPRNLIDLYDWLIRPVEGLLPQPQEDIPTADEHVPHLIIIPSGPLYYLPFQALIWTSKDYSKHAPLIARYALSYSPSVATLKYAGQRETSAYPQATFLGLADPVPGNPKIPRLPEARAEAEAVARLFTDPKVYVDKQATEDVVQSHSATAREVLLSTHGFFNPHNPMSSYLLTTPTAKNKDGRLYAYEVFRLPLHADMVVLSACETLLPAIEEMKGQIRAVRGAKEQNKPVQLTEDQLKELTAGDEVVGLTRAFISAGAASVLSSLWSVPSDSTEKLMVSFYKHMKEGTDKAEALRAAELAVMNTSNYTQPWYWAAFNLMGDWR